MWKAGRWCALLTIAKGTYAPGGIVNDPGTVKIFL